MTAASSGRREPEAVGDAAPSGDSEYAACCSDFYSSDAVRLLLGDSFHPGGEELTLELLEMASAAPDLSLLDVGGGLGTSAELAARKFGCAVSVVDRAPANVERTRARVTEAGLSDRVTVVQADVHELPFPAGSFDIVLCECVFSTFTGKPAAAAQLLRVLRAGGKLALSDVTLEAAELPQELASLLARVACLADAPSEQKLTALLAQAGFAVSEVRDASWALREMAQRVKRRLVALRVAGQLKAVDTGGFDLTEGKRLAERALELIDDGDVGYVALVATPRTAT
jgi:SAM-dependent methyltransferase